MPSISKLGSGSAYPFSWANFKVWSKSAPSSIWESIKFDVPFNIPDILLILLPANSSFSILMIGVPAHTDDSYKTWTFFSLALVNISSPWWYKTALFAVTTWIPLSIDARINSRATSTPPINSTITSMSWSNTSKISRSILVSLGSHFGLSLLAPITTISMFVFPADLICSEFESIAL